jgi:hypothetical protein
VLGPGLTPIEEHVIGRNFVPRGALQGSWNLIVQACEPCNTAKSDLEDDISAITMQPHPTGRHASSDPRLITTAKRKARGFFSRLTSKSVELSAERFDFQHSMGPMTLDFRFDAPPQVDNVRVFHLSAYHVRVFFFWQTYDQTLCRGSIWTGDFAPVHLAPHDDWGNPVHRWFMREVAGWEHRVLAIGADGFFKVLLRQKVDPPVLAWALEWTQNFRIIGFCGDPANIDAVAASKPTLDLHLIQEVPGQYSRYYRMHEVLAPTEDDFFTMPGHA